MFHPAVYEGTPVEQGKFVNNVCQEPVRQPLFESHMKRKVVEPIPSETAQISASHCKISKSMGSEGVTKVLSTLSCVVLRTHIPPFHNSVFLFADIYNRETCCVVTGEDT